MDEDFIRFSDDIVLGDNVQRTSCEKCRYYQYSNYNIIRLLKRLFLKDVLNGYVGAPTCQRLQLQSMVKSSSCSTQMKRREILKQGLCSFME
jgi:hypothetical protein